MRLIPEVAGSGGNEKSLRYQCEGFQCGLPKMLVEHGAADPDRRFLRSNEIDELNVAVFLCLVETDNCASLQT